MPSRIGLMGLGRIGRNVFRILYDNDDIRLQAISDVADPAALTYLLRFDTILGRFPDELSLRDGMIYWSSGKRSWLAREGPGVMLGDIDTGRHFYFRRNAG